MLKYKVFCSTTQVNQPKVRNVSKFYSRYFQCKQHVKLVEINEILFSDLSKKLPLIIHMASQYKSYRSSLNSILNWRFYHFTNYNTCALKHLILINSEQKWHPKHPKKYLASQDIMTCNEISESTIHFNTKSHQNLRINNSLQHNITPSKTTIKPNVYPQ